MMIPIKEETKQEVEEEEESVFQAERRFPSSFYCPITMHLMVDPVVAPDGFSYERCAMASSDSQTSISECYPNLALQAIIEAALSRDAKERGARHRRSTNEIVQSGRQPLAAMSQSPSQLSACPSFMGWYFCPITHELMQEPVIDPEGSSFEKLAIENWTRANGISPISGVVLTIESLRPNRALRDLIEEKGGERSEDSDNSSHCRWKVLLTAKPGENSTSLHHWSCKRHDTKRQI
jgi:hypothetical protein